MENDQYFSVAYQLNANVQILDKGYAIPDPFQFDEEIPTPFKMANEGNAMSPGLHRALNNLGDSGKEIGLYLKAQSNKLDMVLSYVLSLQDDPNQRTQTTHFGGSELSFTWEKTIPSGTPVRIKLFLPEESAAVYCYAQITDNQLIKPGVQRINCSYTQIREQDREVLVRASLHVQSKQLQKRSESRRQTQDNSSQ